MISEQSNHIGHGTAKIDLGGAGGDFSDDDGPPYIIHGYAIGADDEVNGPHGKMRWSGAALESIADTLEGRPLTDEHSKSPHATVGAITAAAYDGTGVAYEAELDEKGLAKRIAAGRLEVSPRIAHADPEVMNLTDDGMLDVQAEHAGEFRHLSIVQRGAAPGNSVASGTSANEALTAMSAGEVRQSLVDCGANVADSGPRVYGIDWPDDLDERESILQDAEEADIPVVTWDGGNSGDNNDESGSGATGGSPENTTMHGTTTDAEELAEAVLRGEDKREMSRKNFDSCADYLEGKFRVDASEYDDKYALREAVIDAKNGLSPTEQRVDAQASTADGRMSDFAETMRSGSPTGDGTAADQMARDAMQARHIRAASSSEQSAAEYLKSQFDIDASEYTDTADLREAVMDASAEAADPTGNTRYSDMDHPRFI